MEPLNEMVCFSMLDKLGLIEHNKAVMVNEQLLGSLSESTKTDLDVLDNYCQCIILHPVSPIDSFTAVHGC